MIARRGGEAPQIDMALCPMSSFTLRPYSLPDPTPWALVGLSYVGLGIRTATVHAKSLMYGLSPSKFKEHCLAGDVEYIKRNWAYVCTEFTGSYWDGVGTDLLNESFKADQIGVCWALLNESQRAGITQDWCRLARELRRLLSTPSPTQNLFLSELQARGTGQRATK